MFLENQIGEGKGEIAKVSAERQKAESDLTASVRHAEETHTSRMVEMQRSHRDREQVGERRFAEVSQELSATAEPSHGRS